MSRRAAPRAGDAGGTNEMTSEEQQDERPKRRARTRRDPGRALMSAIERGDLRALSEQHLLDAVPATVDTRPATSGWTPLMMAAAAGEPEVVSALLDAGGDHGEALMIACALGRTAVSRLLIEDGADVSTSAPASSRSSTTPACPFCAARSSGVAPPGARARLGSAPAPRRSSTTPRKPRSAAA